MKYGHALVLGAFLFVSTTARGGESAHDLVGVWEAQQILLPHLRGTLYVIESGGQWRAEIAGTRATGEADGREVRFHFVQEDGEHVLLVRLDARGRVRNAQWTQPATFRVGSRNNFPVPLKPAGKGRWRGEVTPIEDGFTFYMVMMEQDDGTIGAFLRNPDRNLGVFTNLKRMERDGDELNFIGTFSKNKEEQSFYIGYYDPDRDIFSIYIPNRGGTYDFYKVTSETNDFYARGKNPPPYTYTPPPQTGDGWPTATLDQVDIALAPLADMVEKEIEPAPHSVHDHDVHGVLIARHGKLVFEEYFHGYHRDWPHDTRSASKSLTAVLVGAAMQAGYPLSVDMPVYGTIYGDAPPPDLDPRKSRMTLEHLLTMTSGFYCDDRDSDAPGREDTMQSQQEEPDWYRYTLALPMAYEPGEEGIYCSCNSNLAGKVLIEATGESLQNLFQDLIAGPLDLGRYHLQLQPTGEPYMGGGIRWLPRDFMKLGQLLLDDGVWRGKRVVSKDWAKRCVATQVTVRDREYGYAWWIEEYPYKGGTVRAFLAGGNGGQIVVGIPDLDLVIAFYGGNYSDSVTYRSQNVLVPEYILKAVAQGAP